MLFGRSAKTLTNLLIVEDEPLVAFDTEHLLTDKGYTVVATVDRVADAVRLIGDGQAIDLVLADVSLADGSGLDVARAADARGIPVLFVTGSYPKDAEALAMGWLAKPYSPRALFGAVEAIGGAVAGKPPRRLPAGMQLFDRPPGLRAET